MATCMYCGSEIADNVKFCTNCGAALPVEAPIPQSTYDAPAQQPAYDVPAQQPNEQPYQQPPQQQPYQQAYQQPYQQAPAVEDSGSIGWAILGFIIPIVGIVLYFVWRTTKPKCAKMAGIGALVSVVIALLFRIAGVS